MTDIEPDKSWAVLVGTSTFDDSRLNPLPAVDQNLTSLKEVLCDEDLVGFKPENVKIVHNPRDAVGIIAPLTEVASKAEGTLLFYYAGHGLLDEQDNSLHLSVTSSEQSHVDLTSLPYSKLRRRLNESTAARRLVILDCCYSGQAAGIGMAGGVEAAAVGQLQGISGAWTLTATAGNALALAPANLSHTAFTDQLLGVLKEGEEGRGAELDCGAIYEAVKRRMAAHGYPQPRQLVSGELTEFRFSRNKKHSGRHRTKATPRAPKKRDDPRESAALMLHVYVSPADEVVRRQDKLGEDYTPWVVYVNNPSQIEVSDIIVDLKQEPTHSQTITIGTARPKGRSHYILFDRSGIDRHGVAPMILRIEFSIMRSRWRQVGNDDLVRLDTEQDSLRRLGMGNLAVECRMALISDRKFEKLGLIPELFSIASKNYGSELGRDAVRGLRHIVALDSIDEVRKSATRAYRKLENAGLADYSAIPKTKTVDERRLRVMVEKLNPPIRPEHADVVLSSMATVLLREKHLDLPGFGVFRVGKYWQDVKFESNVRRWALDNEAFGLELTLSEVLVDVGLADLIRARAMIVGVLNAILFEVRSDRAVIIQCLGRFEKAGDGMRFVVGRQLRASAAAE